jgi:hypothetical protein
MWRLIYVAFAVFMIHDLIHNAGAFVCDVLLLWIVFVKR